MARDGFTERTRRELALRAAYVCSRPGCAARTVFPKESSNQGAIVVGKAAHICAASPGGKRYDPKQTEAERRHISNGIWLCSVCHDVVDQDEVRYPADLLRSWKAEHEGSLKRDQDPAPLPLITIRSYPGLILPQSKPISISGEQAQRFRDHDLIVQNVGRRKIMALTLEALLPESVTSGAVAKSPVGVTVQHGPVREEMIFVGAGDGKIVSQGQRRPIPKIGVQVNELLPGQRIEYRFRTLITELDAQDLAEGAGCGPVQLDEYTTGLNHYFRGGFQYPDGDQFHQRELVVPLTYQSDERKIGSLDVEPNIGQFRFREVMRFW